MLDPHLNRHRHGRFQHLLLAIEPARGDVLAGGQGADQLIGGDGVDILTGGAGNDVITGAAGSDTAVFKGTSDGFTLRVADDGTLAGMNFFVEGLEGEIPQ